MAGGAGESGEAGAVANVAPEAQAEPVPEAASPPKDAEGGEEGAADDAKADAKESSKAGAPKPAPKSAARSRTVKPSHGRSKAIAKIAPFNGALTGLFAPGAPANKRR